MANGSEAEKQELIEQLQALIDGRWPADSADRVRRFVGRYFHGVAPEDLLQRPIEDLYGAAASHWQLLQQRRGETPQIHVYNPDPEQHGWESTHTVIQIVTDDMPFLVDSVSMALNRDGLTIHLIIHPVVPMQHGEGEHPQACMLFEVDRQTDQDRLHALREELMGVLGDVRAVVSDWAPMRERMRALAGELAAAPPPSTQDIQEAVAFLNWLADDHFTFLGYRCYELQRREEGDVLARLPETGLGLLRDTRPQRSHSFSVLPAEIQRRARLKETLIVSKSNTRASVHRPGYMDYIGLKRFDADGEVIGEHRFLGLYTSSAYASSPADIPLLRKKLAYVLERTPLPADSHAGKALRHILESYPRDELFQIEPETLHDIALGILHLQERQRLKLFVRYDTYRRFVSCLVFAPRERYDTVARQRMQELLQKAFGGSQIDFGVQLSESVLARVHFIIRLPEPDAPAYDHAALEAQLAQVLRAWTDDYRQGLLEHFGEEHGNRLYLRYRDAFSAAYRENTSPRLAVHDTERLETLSEHTPLTMSLYRPLEAPEGMMRFKLYHGGRPITLSEVMPMLENMGVQVIDERPYDAHPADAEPRWIRDFGLRHQSDGELNAEQVREAFQDAFAAVWNQRIEDDGFNRLTLAAGLSWPQIVILRAYTKYLRQAGGTLSQALAEQTLANYPHLARKLVELFHARLDPAGRDIERARQLSDELQAALNEVPTLDEDRILRRYLAAIRATTRTNYFQRPGGELKPFFSFKVEPGRIPYMPKPYPRYEIYVYATYFEGVHLRGDKVARGGIRWSDRREDFRTEVLGLMKAQMVKNAVIVPVGAKGGFFPKRLPAEREAMATEVRRCYADFIRGLLDITDNRAEGGIVPPPELVRHDEDDPYLVVAADKGTARFSDLANSISAEYGFWLKDAFASGGSSGYDHKVMGITARGGWEAVKRHFRELGIDIQREPFSVVGIGDMSGDVFGNAMLLSPQIRLLAAFDHRHVFIDPDPDPAISFAERQRLFQLPRSSWADYDATLISAGGGVYPRTAKSIELSAEARRALGIEEAQLSPHDLIRAVLRAPVDLLWNGGIGTYVKAVAEPNAEVGDKTNDPVRINGAELRCRVVGEGGNLGFTQRGRIEYARAGGRLNTDAIDNSAGVDCSDHEVNIKILLNEVVDRGDLTLKQRDALLLQMTDEVARLVLRDNYRQTQALSLSASRADERLDEHARFMRSLEKRGRLERPLELLPNDEAIAERAAESTGLTRPELAVLLAYAKIDGYGQLLLDPVLDEPYLQRQLLNYFPAPLREGFAEAVLGHRLRQEITATALTNDLIDRMGVSFLYRMQEEAGCKIGEVARAFLAAQEIFGLGELWRQVDALNAQVAAEVQTRMLREIVDFHEQTILWLIGNRPLPLAIQASIDTLGPPVQRLTESLEQSLPEDARTGWDEQSAQLAGSGVPPELARQIARLRLLYPALDIVEIGAAAEGDLQLAAQVYFLTLDRLGLDWLSEAIGRFEPANAWQERYRAGLDDELYLQLRRLSGQVLAATEGAQADARVERWLQSNGDHAERLQQTVAELRGTGKLDLAMLAVALQELKRLVNLGAATPPPAQGTP